MSALLKKIIFVCAAPFVFVSCATLSQSSGSSKVMTVFMEDGTLKHYIRPSVMTAAAPQEKSSVMIDFTYRMKNRDTFLLPTRTLRFTRKKTCLLNKRALSFLPARQRS